MVDPKDQTYNYSCEPHTYLEKLSRLAAVASISHERLVGMQSSFCLKGFNHDWSPSHQVFRAFFSDHIRADW